MKKLTYLLVSILCSFTLSSFLKAVPNVPPVRTLEIPLSEEIMNFDGNDSESSWSAAQSVNLFNADGWSGASDFSGYFKVCQDKNFLYLFANVTDDVNHSYDPSYAEPWMFDCVELYLNLDTNDHPSTAYDDNTIQLRFNRGLSAPTEAGRADPGDYIYYYKEKAGGDGWILELGVPWTSAMPPGSLPEDINDFVANTMGFDVLFSDSDNADGNIAVGNRDSHAAWDDDDPSSASDRTEDLAWNNTSVFGIVELMLEPPPAAIPYAEPVRTLQIPARNDRIFFDGEANETSWSSAQTTSIFYTSGYTGTSDLDASLKFTWDKEYLYFFADITDDIDHSFKAGLSESWMFDCVELFIDLDTVMGTVMYDENTIQLRLHRGMNEIETLGRANANEFIYHWENKTGNDGWVIEAGLPWTCVLPEGTIPEDIENYIHNMIGLDVNISDSDNSDGNANVGNRDAQAAWDEDGLDGTEDLAWNNTHVFGIVELIGDPLPPDPPLIGLPFTKPVKDTDVPVMNTSFNADVQDTETFWGYPQMLSVFNTSSYSASTDLDAWFRLAWDYDFLYLYAYITDDIDQSWSSGMVDAWNYDNLEVYIDLDTFSMETTYRDNSTIMLRFNRGYDFVQTTGRAGEADFIYAWQNFESGWKLEAAIPWESALATGSVSEDIEDFLPTIGFDIIVNDLDTETLPGREGITQAGWDREDVGAGEDPLEDDAMTNTRMFGIANLSPYGLNPIGSLRRGKMEIFPNPANDQLFFRGTETINRIEIIHITGQVMIEQLVGEMNGAVSIADLPAGIYLFKYISDDSQQGVSLFVKQ